jgi:hypothetical protein
MSNRSSRPSAAGRAEARRRARYIAQGREPADEGLEEEADASTVRRAAPAGGGFLTRLFPPAPPLPNKPDPLADFHYTGRYRGFVSGLYLLGRNPIAWILPGAIWGPSELMFQTGMPNPLLATMASLVAFAALIAAGWIGWQRPWLFGLAAALLGVVIFSGIIGTALTLAGYPDGVAAYVGTASRELLQLAFGAAAGWYGGYLRRRLAAAPTQVRTAHRRR